MAITTVTGTTSAAIQADINAAAAGDILYLPGTTYTLSTTINVNKAITLWFGGGQYNVTHNGPGFSVSAAASLRAQARTTITGPRSTNAYVSGSNAFLIAGASAAAPVQDVIVEGPFIVSQFLEGGVRGEFLRSVSIRGVTIRDCTYFGIALVSALDAHIDSNTVDGLRPEGCSALGAAGVENAYGITVTRSSGSTTTYPIPERIWITNNRIRGVKTWHGIDTHGARKLHIVDNDVQECRDGIYLTLTDASGTYLPPAECVVRGNRLRGQFRTPDLRSGWGIFVSGEGAAAPAATQVLITDNQIYQFGWKGTSGHEAAAGISAAAVAGLNIRGNQVIDCGHRGILLAGSTPATAVFGSVGGNYVQSITGVSDSGAGLESYGAYVACTLDSGTFYSMAYALHAPIAPASGNFGLWVARAIGVTHITALFSSNVGRIDLGATPI
ncbi:MULTISPECIES: right-handed parallel beta-helix repeat-containing protein [unclassified Bosea (in: a-proteobacteria)]|uniref:right-handed parallel beta-helix repeat-containing protein n=1 Tax=unclassified Bosea (in: a-proteobacteria) TaxID=2653178 RepID=UPI0013E089BA|nr:MULTISPECIES: right-handed parallel beta-helix repeat-containing protein [unclassified Bosea (in: a-proteobacteria)]